MKIFLVVISVCVYFHFFKKIYDSKKLIGIHSLKSQNGVALQDLISGTFDFISNIEFPKGTRIHLIELLSEIE